MVDSLAKFVSTAVLGLAAVAAAPSASAAIVTGSWDPALPQEDFFGLGWTTTINVNVDEQCRLDDGSTPRLKYKASLFGADYTCDPKPGNDFDNNGAVQAYFSILSAEVGIYELSSMLIKDVLRFDANSFEEKFIQLSEGGAITYLLSTSPSNVLPGGIPATNRFEFQLRLPGEAPALDYRSVGQTGSFTNTPTPTRTQFFVNDPNLSQDEVLRRTQLISGQRVFTGTVPEPGSLALALLALGAAGAVAARRTRRAA